MKYLLLLPMLLCTSCLVTSADLQKITDSMAAYENAATPEALTQLQADVAAVVGDVEKRGDDWMKAGLGLMTVLTGGGYGVTRMAAAKVNRDRDAARVKRGEEV